MKTRKGFSAEIIESYKNVVSSLCDEKTKLERIMRLSDLIRNEFFSDLCIVMDKTDFLKNYLACKFYFEAAVESGYYVDAELGNLFVRKRGCDEKTKLNQLDLLEIKKILVGERKCGETESLMLDIFISNPTTVLFVTFSNEFKKNIVKKS